MHPLQQFVPVQTPPHKPLSASIAEELAEKARFRHPLMQRTTGKGYTA